MGGLLRPSQVAKLNLRWLADGVTRPKAFAVKNSGPKIRPAYINNAASIKQVLRRQMKEQGTTASPVVGIADTAAIVHFHLNLIGYDADDGLFFT